MNTYDFNDGLRPGRRRPRLYLARGGEVRKFTGDVLPGFCAIVTSWFTKNGDWSNTQYKIALAPGVRAIEFMSPLHGTWGDDVPSWGAAAEWLQLPVETVREIVRAEYPRTAERLDQLEAFAADVAQEKMTVETVIVSFGSPMNKEIRDGFWEKPKKARTTDGREVIVQPGQGRHGPDWAEAVAVAPEGAKVLAARHKPGIHGGHWHIEVAVPVQQS